MVFLNFLNSYTGFYTISLIITGILIFAKLGIKRKFEEVSSIKLFFDILALMSIIALTYFIASNGKFIFGTEAKDLFLPIGVTIIFLVINSLKSIVTFFRNHPPSSQ